MESTFVALRNVNVRAAPDVGAAKVASLDKGSEVYVSGKVTAKDWLAVDQNGKRLGYVYSKLLQDKETFIAETGGRKNNGGKKLPDWHMKLN